MKIKCAIVEDKPDNLDLLKIYCSRHREIDVIGVFLSGNDFLESPIRNKIDLCLLDIDMGGISGMEVARKIGGAKVIFVSGHPKYALESYDLNVIDFVSKPVNKERLDKALEKAKRVISKRIENGHAFFKTNLGDTRIFFEDIQYIKAAETSTRNKTLVTKSGDVHELKSYTFNDLLGILPSSSFSQINKSCLIHHDAFVSFPSKDEVCFKNPVLGEKNFLIQTLSNTYHEAFEQKIKGK